YLDPALGGMKNRETIRGSATSPEKKYPYPAVIVVAWSVTTSWVAGFQGSSGRTVSNRCWCPCHIASFASSRFPRATEGPPGSVTTATPALRLTGRHWSV